MASSGQKLVEDANLVSIASNLGCQTAMASDIMQKMLQSALSVPPAERARRLERIQSLQKTPDLSGLFHEFSALEKDCSQFLESKGSDSDALQKDTLGQLIFTGEDWVSLNHVPFFLLIISLIKRFLVPATILLFPVLTIVFPYILLRFIYKIPINVKQYVHILKTLWLGKNGGGPQSWIQILVMIASFAQSVIEPLKQAMHIHKTDGIIVEIGGKLGHLCDIARELQGIADSVGFKKYIAVGVEDVPVSCARQTAAWFYADPNRFDFLQASVAEFEIYWRLARDDRLRPAIFLPRGSTVLYKAQNLVDMSIQGGKGSSCSLVRGARQHAIVTGPNGGGKSSFMRGVIQSILLSHTFGVVAADIELQQFDWIASGIRLHDSPGELSMFETEVQFAAQVLRLRGQGIVLFDELFHSTNPPDAERTSQVFLEKLWKSREFCSIVSTHMFSLVELAPAQRWCFSTDFTLRRGVCRLSSVNQIWTRFQFPSAAESSEKNSRGS
jgi:MutS domain V